MRQIQKKSRKKQVKKSPRRIKEVKLQEGPWYQADRSFELFEELRRLIIKAAPNSFPLLEQTLKRVGRVKLAVVSGVFLNVETSRIDLLLVGNGISTRRLMEEINEIESTLGREIRYVVLTIDEFTYRYKMFDRFLRDIFSLPHQKIINKLKV